MRIGEGMNVVGSIVAREGGGDFPWRQAGVTLSILKNI